MSELWYWKSNDRIRGPLVTEELEAIVLKNRLADLDAVRLDGSDEWLSATEIRQLFLRTSADSPAQTAARLLKSAAARRLRSEAHAPEGTALGGLVGRLTGATGELTGSLFELAARGLDSSTRWLGNRGRMLVTILAAMAVLVFLTSRWITWGPSDLGRLQQIQAVWKHAQTSQSGDAKAKPSDAAEVEEWLDLTQRELEAALRAHPVSGSTGAERQTALARREMLFAVRELRKSTPPDDAGSERIENSLEAASDYLGGTPSVENPQVVATDSAGDSGPWGIIAMVVIDVIIVSLVAIWWIATRARR